MKTRKFVILIAITAIILLAATAVVPAMAMGMNAPVRADVPLGGITSDALFTWLLGSGGLVLVLSWLVERWAWYQTQSPDWKKVLFIGGVVILGSFVHALQLYIPAAVWAQIDPWFQFVSGLMVLGAGAMGLHALTKPVETK